MLIKFVRIFLLVLIVIGLGLMATQSLWVPQVVDLLLQNQTDTVTEINTYGMSKYTDLNYGFSFWYPNTLQITAKTTEDSADFPGGVAVETLQIGSAGGTSIVVVNSPMSIITDEPSNHASPIAQTKYFYESTSGRWMMAFPESINSGGPSATTTANISKTTMSGLVMLPSGRRFDTTIIPLSTVRFLVISDGGGSSFTSQLAQTVAQVDIPINPSIQADVLQTEAAAYAPAATYYNGRLICTSDLDCPTSEACLRSGPILAGQQTPKVCVPNNRAVPL